MYNFLQFLKIHFLVCIPNARLKPQPVVGVEVETPPWHAATCYITGTLAYWFISSGMTTVCDIFPEDTQYVNWKLDSFRGSDYPRYFYEDSNPHQAGNYNLDIEDADGVKFKCQWRLNGTFKENSKSVTTTVMIITIDHTVRWKSISVDKILNLKSLWTT